MRLVDKVRDVNMTVMPTTHDGFYRTPPKSSPSKLAPSCQNSSFNVTCSGIFAAFNPSTTIPADFSTTSINPVFATTPWSSTPAIKGSS